MERKGKSYIVADHPNMNPLAMAKEVRGGSVEAELGYSFPFSSHYVCIVLPSEKPSAVGKVVGKMFPRSEHFVMVERKGRRHGGKGKRNKKGIRCWDASALQRVIDFHGKIINFAYERNRCCTRQDAI